MTCTTKGECYRIGTACAGCPSKLARLHRLHDQAMCVNTAEAMRYAKAYLARIRRAKGEA
jgi:hypothetical protein